ncbi:MAG: class I SAM-dependent methyltransferase [Limisphaerales bacterium]
MMPFLEQESEKLARSWERHDAVLLRDYLVAGVEDPRINVQSILTRHFLLRALGLERCRPLMEEEYRFASAMNWLVKFAGQAGDGDEMGQVLHALRKGGDNAEGIEIPRFLIRTFALLARAAYGPAIPNYIETFLLGAQFQDGQARPCQSSLDTFRELWGAVLAAERPAVNRPLTVLEPACGSANDYRFIDAFGIARLVDYHGFDLCRTNIENARALFPGVRFEPGNVFEIAAPDKSFDTCFVHDLFEHLSPAGIEAAAREICRVTRQGLCVGFFNMDEIPAHKFRPVREYYWNLLSMERMKEVFAGCGFAAQAVNIGAFLRGQTGCDQTHNPNAYTFVLGSAK